MTHIIKKSAIIFATMLLSCANLWAQSGTTGDLQWKIEDNTLTISGTGDMPNYSSKTKAPWAEYTFTKVIIENGVTAIGDYAFSGCSGLTSVEIPNSVTSIGERAFYGCTGLTSVEIPNSVTSIGQNAFYSCRSLTSVVIGNGVKIIKENAFSSCSSLTSVKIPNSVTNIGDYAF